MKNFMEFCWTRGFSNKFDRGILGRLSEFKEQLQAMTKVTRTTKQRKRQHVDDLIAFLFRFAPEMSQVHEAPNPKAFPLKRLPGQKTIKAKVSKLQSLALKVKLQRNFDFPSEVAQKHFEEFERKVVDHLERTELDVSSNTFINMISDFRQFFHYLVATKRWMSHREITREDIEGFKIWSKNRGVAPRSTCRRLATIRHFFRGLDYADNPAKYVKGPKFKMRNPRSLTFEELERFFDAIDIKTRQGLVVRALFELLYGSGLWIGEAVGLQINDAVFRDKERGSYVRIREAKRDSAREAPLSEIATVLIEKVISLRRESDVCRAIFTTGIKVPKTLTERSAQRWMQKYLEKAGIKEVHTTHDFRSTFCTHLLVRGAGIEVVQSLMGHKYLESIQHYRQVVTKDQLDAYRKYHPRALREWKNG